MMDWACYIRDVVVIPYDPEFSPITFSPLMFKDLETRKRWHDSHNWVAKCDGGCEIIINNIDPKMHAFGLRGQYRFKLEVIDGVSEFKLISPIETRFFGYPGFQQFMLGIETFFEPD